MEIKKHFSLKQKQFNFLRIQKKEKQPKKIKKIQGILEKDLKKSKKYGKIKEKKI